MTRDGLDLNDASAVVGIFEAGAAALRANAFRCGCAVRLPAEGRLLATGDLHDNPFHLDRILALAGLETAPDRHVVLHELIHGERLLNGMDFSYRMLARVADLCRRHPNQVHVLLANHELSQMTGRGVSKGAGNSVELFADALDYVFGDEREAVNDAIRAFIRAMPVALVSEGGVLCAHSLPAPKLLASFDFSFLDRALEDDDYASPLGCAYAMTWGRGHRPEDIERVADALGVRFVCLGHEHAETGIELRGPRHLVLNSDHERGTVLPLDLADVPDAAEAMLHAVPLSSVGLTRS